MPENIDFWEFIKFRPGLKATACTWSKVLGTAIWSNIKKDIFRSAGISFEIPHPEYGYPLRIIKVGNELYNAVCPGSGEVVISKVPEAEILSHQIIPKVLCNRLCQLFGFSRTAEFSVVPLDIIPIGVWEAVPGHNVAVSLVLLPSEQILQQKLLEFLSCDNSEPRILFIPTGSDNGISAELYKKAEDRKVLLLPLNQYVSVSSGGFELAAEQWEQFQTRFIQRYYPDMLIPKGPEYALVQKGDFWDLTFQGKTVHLQDTVGMKYLLQLIMEPNKEISCSDLISLVNGNKPIKIEESVEPLADEVALKDYEKRLKELYEEIEESKKFNDGRHESLQTDCDNLSEEYIKLKGLGSKTRNLRTDLSKNRTPVTNALIRIIQKLLEDLPEAGSHFETYINKGVFCSYCPLEPIEWEF